MKITIDPEAETDLRALLRHQGQGLPGDQASELIHVLDMWGFRKLRRVSFEAIAAGVSPRQGAVVGANVYRYVFAAMIFGFTVAAPTTIQIRLNDGTNVYTLKYNASLALADVMSLDRAFIIPPGWRLEALFATATNAQLNYAFVEYDLVEHCPQF